MTSGHRGAPRLGAGSAPQSQADTLRACMRPGGKSMTRRMVLGVGAEDGWAEPTARVPTRAATRAPQGLQGCSLLPPNPEGLLGTLLGAGGC